MTTPTRLQQEIADLDTSLKALEQLTDREQAGIRDVQKYKLADRVFREDIARLQGLFEPIIRRLEEIKLIRDRLPGGGSVRDGRRHVVSSGAEARSGA